jgi:hypothetical protein
LAKNHTETWIKQFIDAEWGFSIAGKPVVQSFNRKVHLSKSRLRFDPLIPLIAGFDPGLTGGAMIFGQQDIDGHLRVLGEIITSGVGARRFITEKLQPYAARNFPGLMLSRFIIAPDPAAANRGGTDERTIVDVLKTFYQVAIESNNRLPLRLDAIDFFATKLVMGVPGLLVDETACPVLARALKGGWRYKLDKNEAVAGVNPEKNSYSHPGDAFGYLCRYFHKGTIRAESNAGAKPMVVAATNIYHFK